MGDRAQLKVLILSGNTGEGHNSAARAIEAGLADKNIVCETRDVLTFKSEKTSEGIAGLYSSVIKKAPKFFGVIFTLGKWYDDLRLPSPIYKSNARYADKLYEYIKENGYNCVICTHLFAMQAITAVRRKYQLAIDCYGVMTDYVIHPFVKDSDLDGYFVPSEAVAKQFMKKGFPREKLFVTGIPVHAEFSQSITKQEARESLNLPQDKKTVVIMTGGAGCGKVAKLCKKLNKTFGDDKLFVVLTGRNEKLKAKLDAKFADNAKFKAVEFTQETYLYLKAADCVLSKAGGLSSTEIAVANVPLIHLKAVPGLETINLKYFSRNGLSLRANNIGQAVKRLKEFFASASCAEEIIAAQKQYINANATEQLINTIGEHDRDCEK